MFRLNKSIRLHVYPEIESWGAYVSNSVASTWLVGVSFQPSQSLHLHIATKFVDSIIIKIAEPSFQIKG